MAIPPLNSDRSQYYLSPDAFFPVSQQPDQYPSAFSLDAPIGDPADRTMYVRDLIDPSSNPLHQDGLRKLSDWALQLIDTGPHSLYRSIAIQLMNEDILRDLKIVDPNPQPHIDSSILIEDTRRWLQSGVSPRQILARPTVSNAWVALLRNLSNDWWEHLGATNPSDFRFHAFRYAQSRLAGRRLSNHDALAWYQQNAGSLETGALEGIYETAALSSVLGHTIHFINIDTALSAKDLNPNGLHILCGVFPNQFDALYHPSKIPSSVQTELSMSTPPQKGLSCPYDDRLFDEIPIHRIDPWSREDLFRHPISAEEFAQTLPQGHPCKAIQELKGCFIQKVFADGHCLFRSLAALLMRPSALEMLIARAEQLQRGAPPGVDLKDLFSKTKELRNSGKLPGEILYSSCELSKNWVLFLRYLAMQYWSDEFAKDPNSVQTFLANEKSQTHETDDDMAMAEYMTTICSYENPRWGDHTEIQAIQAVLGITITIANLVSLKRTNGSLLPANPDPNHFYIVFSPNPFHYNALFVPGQPH